MEATMEIPKNLVNSEQLSDTLMSDKEVEAAIHAYEQRFSMTSEEFLEKKSKGEFPDIYEGIDWAILLEHR
jgi:hypothetical protein